MSYLEKQMQFLKYDKRLLEINLKNGTLTQADYDQHVTTLRDDASRSERMDLENDSEDRISRSMNGQNHAVAAPKPVATPSSDPFGSGY
jgi:hypothetical protein